MERFGFVEDENTNNKPVIKTMVIDDFEDTGLVIDTVLNSGESESKYFYEIYFFNSSVEAMEVFKNNSSEYELIITDYEMPLIKGDEFISKVRDIIPSLKVIVISAWLDSFNIQKGSTMKDVFEKIDQPSAAIEKPFPSNFSQIIDSVIDGTNGKKIFMASEY